MNMKAMAYGGVLLAVLVGATVASAGIPSTRFQVTPGQVNYQGRLMTAAGNMYTNGVYTIEFRIWDASSGGNVLWGGKYTAYVTEGYFNVMLGMPGGATVDAPAPPVTVLPAELWKALWFDSSSGNNNDRYLGIKVLNDANGDPLLPANAVEAFPRQQMLCSPFAERAQMAQYARQSIDDFSVPGKITVDGQIKGNGGMNVTGGATISGAITASSGATFANGIIVNGAVADLNKGLDVDGGKTWLRAGAEVIGGGIVNGGLTVSGDAVLNNNLRVKGDLTVDDDASMDTLTLAGFQSTADVAIDFGSYYAIYGDNTGYGTSSNRLWMSAPSGGEIVMGPRSGNLDMFRIKSNNTTIQGTSLNINDVSSINVKGGKPIVVRRFTFPANVESYGLDTGYNTTDWSAMMVGFDWGYADIEEVGGENTFECRMVQSGGRWYIMFEGHYKNNYADPVVDVMFVKRELVDDNR